MPELPTGTATLLLTDIADWLHRPRDRDTCYRVGAIDGASDECHRLIRLLAAGAPQGT